MNKTEGLDPSVAVAEFHALGLGEPVAISSAHGEGLAVLMQRVLAPLPQVAEAVMDVLLNRKSVRAYEEREISAEVRAEILKAALRAPTAGNLILYSILDVTDQTKKDKLALTCDN